MRRTAWILSVYFLFMGGAACIKDTSCKSKSPGDEQGAIMAYAAANSITGTMLSSGLYYQVVSPGSGPTPGVNSQISVRYTGKLLDGTVFEPLRSTPSTFMLGGVIPGWQLGLQLIQKGGVIRLIIPSAMAYGCDGKGPIPGNAILFFEIQLVDVL